MIHIFLLNLHAKRLLSRTHRDISGDAMPFQWGLFFRASHTDVQGRALCPSVTRMARRIGFVDVSTLVADGHWARPCKALSHT